MKSKLTGLSPCWWTRRARSPGSKTGALERGTLGAALDKHLAPTGNVRVTVSRLAARIGHPAPNFLFEFAPGRELPLSKLRGRPVLLVFWKSSSPPSIEAVRDLQAGDAKSVVFAINDGEPVDVVRRSAAKHRFAATVVSDPKREISTAYGVNLWPTIVALDAAGLITSIRYGYLKGEHDDAPAQQKTAKPAKRAKQARSPVKEAPEMIDGFVILTPILLLAVIALLGFVGCQLVFPLNPPPPVGPRPNHSQVRSVRY